MSKERSSEKFNNKNISFLLKEEISHFLKFYIIELVFEIDLQDH